jgi:hypothetical protein
VSVLLEDCCGSVLVSCCCYELVAQERGQFGNPEEEERPPLQPVARLRLVKTQQAEKTVRAVANCRVRELAIVL